MPITDAYKKYDGVIDAAGKVALLLGGLCYGLGLIVQNIYLSQFGYFSLSLFKVSYVLAGMWTLGLIGAIILTIYVLTLAFKEVFETKGWRFKVANALFSSALISSAFLLVPQLDIDFSLSLLSTGILGAGAVSLVHDLVTNKTTERKTPKLVFALVVFLTYTVTFAKTCYGDIPQKLGGGKPVIGQIAVSREEYLPLSVMGLTFLDRGTTPLELYMSNPVAILLMTESELLIAVSSGKSILIDRDITRATLMLSLDNLDVQDSAPSEQPEDTLSQSQDSLPQVSPK